jgi:hypothetical protein
MIRAWRDLYRVDFWVRLIHQQSAAVSTTNTFAAKDDRGSDHRLARDGYAGVDRNLLPSPNQALPPLAMQYKDGQDGEQA